MDPSGNNERATAVVLAPDADHCIETVARNEYRRCVDSCLRLDRLDPELEVRVEILRLFLEQADFRRLRRESEPLIRAGGSVRFLIHLDEERACWRIEAEATEKEER